MKAALLGLCLLATNTVFAQNTVFTQDIQVLKTYPVVQQEISVTDFGSICKPYVRNLVSSPECTIHFHTLRLPIGGRIVGATTDSKLVRISTSSDKYSATIEFRPNREDAVNGGTEQEKSDIQQGIRMGLIKVKLLYQGTPL